MPKKKRALLQSVWVEKARLMASNPLIFKGFPAFPQAD